MKAKIGKQTRYEIYNGNALLASHLPSSPSCKVLALSNMILEIIEDFRVFASSGGEDHECGEMRISQNQCDRQSAHILCLQGDAIAAAARFQLQPLSLTPSSSSSTNNSSPAICRLLIDQVYTLSQHYHCRYAYTLLEKILTLVQQVVQQQTPVLILRCLSVAIEKPAVESLSWFVERIVALGFVEECADSSSLLYSIGWVDASSAAQTLGQIIAYIQERKKRKEDI
jgi:hypothetical protein